MGKSGHRKFLKEERAKVKLKGKKKALPKGTNLTDTNFKVKKVVIKDQIKQHSADEILSKKNLSKKELLSRLDHHNNFMKQEALQGLKDLISQYSKEALVHEAGEILGSLSNAILDTNPGFRKEAHKLLNFIISQIPVLQLSPLFSSLCSYLICGLTHIDISIRGDSLKLLETLLVYAPSLCSKHASKLLPICLDLVSETTTGSRVLSLHLDSTLGAGKWRVKVIEQLSSLLAAVSTEEDNENNLKKKWNGVCKVIKWNKDTGTYISLNPQNFSIIPPLTYLNLTGTPSFDKTSDFDFKEFAQSLIPLLLDAFVELISNDDEKDVSDKGFCISILAAEFLYYTIEIIQSLWDILQNNKDNENKIWLKDKFGEIIFKRLVIRKFPYVTEVCNSSKKKKENKNVTREEIEPDCYIINIKLSKLVILMSEPGKWRTVTPYLKNCLRAPNKITSSGCKALASSLSKICFSDFENEAKSIVSSIAKFCTSTQNELSKCLFSILVQIALKFERTPLHSDANFEKWLQFLPTLLLRKNIQGDHLKAISQIAHCNHVSFSQALDGYIEAILDNVPNSEVAGWEKEDADLRLAELVYWVKDWDQDLADGIISGIKADYWGIAVTQHVKDVLISAVENDRVPNLNELLMHNEWWRDNVSHEYCVM